MNVSEAITFSGAHFCHQVLRGLDCLGVHHVLVVLGGRISPLARGLRVGFLEDSEDSEYQERWEDWEGSEGSECLEYLVFWAREWAWVSFQPLTWDRQQQETLNCEQQMHFLKTID